MPTDSSIAVAQEFFAKYFAGDVTGAARLLDKDAVYRAPGRHEIAGVFRGVHQVTEHLSAFLELTGHAVDVLKWEDWLAGVNHVAGLASLHLQREGEFLTIRAVFVVTMSSEGLILEIDAFLNDPSQLDHFFA
ncbi:MAG: nuclear transport factor 2 family protein [Acidimicrobiales bacterium]|nr:nuclear transport factor 2 family protein [Acidimicrobiales bacterium]